MSKERDIKTITEKIVRLAEINRAEIMMNLGPELRDERSVIVKMLVNESIIKLGKSGSGGFQFIGEDANENKVLYLDNHDNF